MTREDIIRMAEECGIPEFENNESQADNILYFAALVVAAEREACAKVCEDIPVPQDPTELTHIPTLERCAAAIRARGSK